MLKIKKNKKIKLIDTITRKMLKRGQCIISKIQQNANFEWMDSDVALIMDNEYYLSHSGEKYISPLYNSLLIMEKHPFVAITEDTDDLIGITDDESEGIIIVDDDNLKIPIDKLSQIIINKFGDKWTRLYDAWTKEYNPIENYSMKEKETFERGVTTDDDLSGDESGGNTRTHGRILTDVKTGGNKTEITGTPVDSIYPSFSSGTSTPVKETQQDTTQETTFDDETLTSTESGTTSDDNSREYASERDISVDEESERNHERSGNIGVTTSQQMLESEINLRNNFNLMNQIYEDIDSIITLLIY